MPDRFAHELSERDREILRDVIHTYLLIGEPVSSRRVAKHERHELSAASIRNVMADLEERGYLTQPHSSAGRIPTTSGYHLFIDRLMETKALSEVDRNAIDDLLDPSTMDAEDLTAATSELLSKLSSQVGIVVTPDLGSTVLAAIEFVPLSGGRVLCVFVSSTGFIDNKVIDLEEPLTREELVEASNYLTSNFGGKTLSQIRDRLVGLMDDARAQVDHLLNRAVALAEKGLDLDSGPDIVIQGTEALLQQPELEDLERVRTLFDTFANKAKVVGMINRCMRGEGVRVFIGDESDLTSELGFSLIATGYGVAGQRVGNLGVFGPSRMEYERLIPLVDYLGARLSAALTATM